MSADHVHDDDLDDLDDGAVAVLDEDDAAALAQQDGPPGGCPPDDASRQPYGEGAVQSEPAGTRISPAPPSGLGAAGGALWESVVSAYELRVDELVLLGELAHCADEVIALRVALDGQWIVEGSKGQPRANPLVTTLHATRTLMIRLAAQLGIPDDDEEPAKATPSSRRAAHAARTRWAGHRDAEAAADAYRRGQA